MCLRPLYQTVCGMLMEYVSVGSAWSDTRREISTNHVTKIVNVVVTRIMTPEYAMNEVHQIATLTLQMETLDSLTIVIRSMPTAVKSLVPKLETLGISWLDRTPEISTRSAQFLALLPLCAQEGYWNEMTLRVARSLHDIVDYVDVEKHTSMDAKGTIT